MKHLNLALEQLEQRIAPGGVPVPSPGAGDDSCASNGSGSKASHNTKHHSTKHHSTKHHSTKHHSTKC